MGGGRGSDVLLLHLSIQFRCVEDVDSSTRCVSPNSSQTLLIDMCFYAVLSYSGNQVVRCLGLFVMRIEGWWQHLLHLGPAMTSLAARQQPGHLSNQRPPCKVQSFAGGSGKGKLRLASAKSSWWKTRHGLRA